MRIQLVGTPINQKSNVIETNGTQVFNVPNTESGKAFMDQAATYLNRPIFKMVKRGRGSRLEHGNQSSIPLPHAEWVAFYVEGGKINAIRNNAWDAQNDNTREKEEIARLKIRIATLEQETKAATELRASIKETESAPVKVSQIKVAVGMSVKVEGNTIIVS